MAAPLTPGYLAPPLLRRRAPETIGRSLASISTKAALVKLARCLVHCERPRCSSSTRLAYAWLDLASHRCSLIVVVECSPSGDCVEAANKFMRDIRKSDGYPVYSEIISRRVAVLALGKPGKVAGASKVEEVLLKRGGCTRMLALPSVGCISPGADVSTLTWTAKVASALDAITAETHGGWPDEQPTPPLATPAAVQKAAQPTTTPPAASPQPAIPAAVVQTAQLMTSPRAASPLPNRKGLQAGGEQREGEPASDGRSSATTLVVATVAAAVLVGLAFARSRRH